MECKEYFGSSITGPSGLGQAECRRRHFCPLLMWCQRFNGRRSLSFLAATRAIFGASGMAGFDTCALIDFQCGHCIVLHACPARLGFMCQTPPLQ